MKKFSLTAIGRGHLDTARRVASGRSANTVFGGHEHTLRQTVIGLAAGRELNEHLNPGEATVFVLEGRLRLGTDDHYWDGRVGDLLVVPPGMYSVTALEDCVLMLTVAKTDRHSHRHNERNEQASSDRLTPEAERLVEREQDGQEADIELAPDATR